jgi:hypothetical protein
MLSPGTRSRGLQMSHEMANDLKLRNEHLKV